MQEAWLVRTIACRRSRFCSGHQLEVDEAMEARMCPLTELEGHPILFHSYSTMVSCCFSLWAPDLQRVPTISGRPQDASILSTNGQFHTFDKLQSQFLCRLYAIRCVVQQGRRGISRSPSLPYLESGYFVSMMCAYKLGSQKCWKAYLCGGTFSRRGAKTTASI